MNCTCNDEINWFTCPLHGLSRPPKLEVNLNDLHQSPIHFHDENRRFNFFDKSFPQIPDWQMTQELILATEKMKERNEFKEEFEKCKDFDFWFENYYLPLKKQNTSSDICFDCEESLF